MGFSKTLDESYHYMVGILDGLLYCSILLLLWLRLKNKPRAVCFLPFGF